MFLTFLIKLVGFLVCRDNGNTGLSVSDQLVYQLKWLGRVDEWLGEPWWKSSKGFRRQKRVATQRNVFHPRRSVAKIDVVRSVTSSVRRSLPLTAEKTKNCQKRPSARARTHTRELPSSLSLAHPACSPHQCERERALAHANTHTRFPTHSP